ncbi:MAG: hypothetical protein FWD93_00620 [Coriobacteriia bacterium]|nr:hypothetical protein [Coriobacteriia bacterium]
MKEVELRSIRYWGAEETSSVLVKLVTVLLFAIVTFLIMLTTVGTAGAAVYKGFTPLDPEQGVPGYITWDQATELNQRNNVPDALAKTAHGGYITTTTKCVVCHSAHRATGINPNAVQGDSVGSMIGSSANNVQNQYFLTAGGSACTNCHVSWGSQATSMLVEWGNPDGGPHASPGSGCTVCHKTGIHGMSNSEFHVMNVFLLGGANDQQLKDELPSLALGPNTAFWVPSAFTGGVNLNPTAANIPTLGNTWWWDGGASMNDGVRVGAPTQIGGLPGERVGAAALINAAQYSAARGIATSYTCSQAGCHENAVMATMQWGVGFERDNTNTGQKQMITGHALPAIMRTNGAYNGNNLNSMAACGPCHTGTFAGFPTDERAVSRVAYGCDQCHDMLGVATNSTAWPHGNRNIRVYEWDEEIDASGNRIPLKVETTMTAGNLWMYSGNIARIRTGPFDPANPFANRPAAASAMGQSVSFAEVNWKVLRGVTGGGAHNVDAALAAAGDYPGYGGLTDGGCLKCHVPIDIASMDGMNSSQGEALRHNWEPTRVGGSSRLFLWK